MVIVAPAGVAEYQEQAVPWIVSPETNIAVPTSWPVKASDVPEYGLAGVSETVGETPASTQAQLASAGTVAVGIVAASASG